MKKKTCPLPKWNYQVKSPPVNLALARKVLAVVNRGLTSGMDDGETNYVLTSLGDEITVGIPGHMCVEAAVCFALGDEHGDQPKCVRDDVIGYKIELNDSDGWFDDADRAKGLRRIAIAQLGSRSIKTRSSITDMVSVYIIKDIVVKLVDANQFDELKKFFNGFYGGQPWELMDYTIKELDATPREALGLMADYGVRALRDMGSPGVKLMDQLIKEGALK